MKKMLKYYLPTFIFLSALGILILFFVVGNHTAVLKYFAGEVGLEGKRKIISTKVNAVVKENGVEQNSVKLFEDGEGRIYLVFGKIDNWGCDVLVVDRERKDIFKPTVRDGYDLIFSRYLVQSETGLRGDYLGGEKFEGYQTKMQITDSQINFQLPEYTYGNGKVIRNRQMEIIFGGE